MKAAAEHAGWETRVSGRQDNAGAEIVSGRGIAYIRAQRHHRRRHRRGRGRTAAAARCAPKRFVVAHDCGLIVNPDGLRHYIEGNIVQGTSRSLWEEVTFDAKNVTSVDWLSYPILDITETPEAVDIVLINHPELPPTGAGEASTRPVAAAIANAIFDATGVRLRRAPFTPDRVKAGLV